MTEPDAAITAFLARSHAACPKCGYDLDGCGGTSCPECSLPLQLQLAPCCRRFDRLPVLLATTAVAIAVRGGLRVIELLRMLGDGRRGVRPRVSWLDWVAAMLDISAICNLVSGLVALALVAKVLLNGRPRTGVVWVVGALAFAAVLEAVPWIGAFARSWRHW